MAKVQKTRFCPYCQKELSVARFDKKGKSYSIACKACRVKIFEPYTQNKEFENLAKFDPERMDFTECKDYTKCLDAAAKQNLSQIGCKKCKNFTPMEIDDYVLTTSGEEFYSMPDTRAA